MEVGPPGPSCRGGHQTATSCFGKEPRLVNVVEKACKTCQVRDGEVNASEPPMRDRNVKDDVETKLRIGLGMGQEGACLLT